VSGQAYTGAKAAAAAASREVRVFHDGSVLLGMQQACTGAKAATAASGQVGVLQGGS
jgi:hypothetical protein